MTKKIVKNVLAFCLGIFITLLFIEIFLRGLGWYQTNRSLFTKITFKNKNEVRILSLGDSMTMAGKKPFYPEQLQNILSKSLPNKKIRVFNEGLTGISSKVILNNLEKNLDKYQPDIVTIMTGSNDYGSVKYEEFAGIKGTDFLSNLKIYRLYKFLLKNIQGKLNRTFKTVQNKLVKTAFAITNDVDLVELGDESFKKGQINVAKDYFEKALQINPNNDQAYFGLGMIFNFNGERDKGKIYFEKVITLNPNNSEAYIKLGEESGNDEISFDEKIWYLQQAIKINPKNSQAYYRLATIYEFLHMDKQLLITLNQGLQINPHSYNLLMALAKYNIKQNKITEAINKINKAFSLKSDLKPKPVDIQLLAELYKSQGKTKEAGEVLGLLTKASEGLTQNYRKMADILKKRGVILIAIQYPMRDISPLKTILKDTDAVFIDNEKNFKEQVTKYGPDKYFVDRFGGNFGHLTVEGHRIVAENIANAILK